MAIEVNPFYISLPHAGRFMDQQWEMFRDDFDGLAPLVRGAFVDKATTRGNDDLSGFSVGELDQRYRYRVFYDKTANELKWQWNTESEDDPSWTDYVTIRDTDGRFTVTGSGGLASEGGFYGFNYLTVSSHGIEDGYSKESVSKISANALEGFYWTDDNDGQPVLNLGGVVRPSYTIGPVENDVLIFDGSNYKEARLDPDVFYISTGGDGRWIISTR